MQTDERGYRIAVVPDELVNDGASGLDVLEVLEQCGWGAIVLPPSWYPRELAEDLLTQFAEQIEEFVRHGYDVVCVGSCAGLVAPLERLGLAAPDSAPDPDDLASFLRARPDPPARR